MTRRKHNPELTAAFNNPNVLWSANDFVECNMKFAIDSLGPQTRKQVLLIGLRLSWLGVLGLVLLNVLLCLGTGTAVGFLARRADLGVAVTSGVAAVTACVQAVLLLVYK